jgi:multisubunit Na+/H+ antiporter MnhB subunit
MMVVFDLLLALMVLATAVFIVAVRDLAAAVAGMIAIGFLLTLVWLRLSAIDVALAEAAIGGGATGIVLLRASAMLSQPESTSANLAGLMGPAGAVAAIGTALIGLALALAVSQLPDVPPSLAAAVMQPLGELGLGNPVTGVLLGYRALDTLLEKIVLLVGLLGIWSLAENGSWSSAPGQLAAAGEAGPLELVARVLPPVGIVIGIYLVWVGADQPGGTFQGGVILAAMWLLPMMAGLAEPPRLDAGWLRLVLFAGPALFILAGLSGFFLAEGFLSFPPAYAKPMIIVIEMALTASIAALATLMILGPGKRRRS